MNEFADLRQLLLAYRLGELSPKEREQLDERIIGDQDFSDQIAEAEYDLIDDYRAGRLALAQRRRVEKAFSPVERRRGSAGKSDSAKTSGSLSDGATLRWLPLSVASLACALAALLLLIVHLHKTQSTGPVTSHASQQPASQVPSVPPVSPNGSGSTQRARAPNHALAVLVLQPIVTRGAAAPVLELEPATQMVQVQWVVPEGAATQPFTLSVMRNGTILKTIAQQGSLRQIGDSLVAEFDLAPGIFTKSPQDKQFLFVVTSDDASQTAMGEFPVMVRTWR